ncbi:MAG: deoxyribodipyrimidine photolyase [Acidobacteria bacterium]|nr:deoxyribodipyrimidine photolyase [Acidobacteriota bacterium]
MTSHSVPALRVRRINDAALRPDGAYVLYWMIASRRLDWNFSLQRAVDHARELGKPLVILEALRIGYPWASDRLHRFVLDGMAEHRARLEGSQVLYHPYVEPEAGAGSGLLETLAARAAVVVTDDYPAFFLPRMVAAAGKKLGVRLEAVDGNGLLPMASADRTFARAFDFRRHLQRELPKHLGDLPKAHPLLGHSLERLGSLPKEVLERWPAADAELLAGSPARLAELPIDHSVPVVDGTRGGAKAAGAVLERFLEERLERYGDGRNHPDEDAASELSPYLHFGHLAAHEVFTAVLEREGWTPEKIHGGTGGARSGWWGASEAAESFLDELITWREVGFNMCSREPGYDRYESLPEWAQETLAEHAGDPRPEVYSLDEFDRAATHDEVWNAAQRQLRGEGKIHNYLRMVWGKKILHWSASPREALDIMIELNNRYALDGRDPNSYSGIFWVLGRYDRAWGPEREVFGKIRYMSCDNTRRKLHMERYLERYGPQASLF